MRSGNGEGITDRSQPDGESLEGIFYGFAVRVNKECYKVNEGVDISDNNALFNHGASQPFQKFLSKNGKFLFPDAVGGAWHAIITRMAVIAIRFTDGVFKKYSEKSVAVAVIALLLVEFKFTKKNGRPHDWRLRVVKALETKQPDSVTAALLEYLDFPQSPWIPGGR